MRDVTNAVVQHMAKVHTDDLDIQRGEKKSHGSEQQIAERFQSKNH